MRFLLVFITVSLFSTASFAQADLCGEAYYIDTSFTNAYKKVVGGISTSADRLYFKNLYFNYRKLMIQDKSDLVSVVALTVITEYTFVLYKEGKFKEGMEEIKFGMENFLENIERGEARCYAAFKGDRTYTANQVQHNISSFFYSGTLLAIELNDLSFAQKILMKLAERDLMGSTPEMNMAANKLLRNKITRREIDDTCFYAAYGSLISKYEEKSLSHALDDFSAALDDLNSYANFDPLKIITDPKFVSYRPPMVKRYKYVNFYDYYIRLYKYLVEKKGDMQSQHVVLKMFLKTFNADKNGGINVEFQHMLGRGSGFSPDAVKEIIKEGDTGLIQLLADFVLDYCSKSRFDDQVLIYGGYLCYYNLGDKKMANKLYKRLNKSQTDRFPKLD